MDAMKASVLGREIQIIPPKLIQPFYRYQLESRKGATSIEAHLTYDLVNPGQPRRLLRVNDWEARELFPVLKEKENASGLNRLRHLVQSKREENVGHLAVLKGLVCDVLEGEARVPNLSVGIHRFGPVPLFSAPLTDIKNRFPDLPDDLELGIFISQNASKRNTGQASKKELLRACKLHLDLVLRCYLEEVAEEFHDTRMYSSRQHSYRRLKRAEEILGESVGSKIEPILKHVADKKIDPELHKLANRAWEDHSIAIVSATYARVFALYFINEIYRFCGIADQTKKYQDRWEDLDRGFRDLLGRDRRAALKDPAGAGPVYFLDETLRRYWGSKIPPLTDLINECDVTWVRQFLEFAEFVIAVRAGNPSPLVPRLFISAQHRVGAAENLVGALERFHEKNTETHGEPRFQFTKVAEERSGTQIEDTVRARIWDATSVLSVIPKDWNSDTEGKSKGLNWVAKELEHALLLSKTPQLLVEENADRDAIAKEHSKSIDFLAPAPLRSSHEKRAKTLADYVRGSVTESFQYSHRGELASVVVEGLTHAVNQARESQGTELILGLLNLFPDEEQEMIARVQLLTKDPLKKSELTRKLASLMKAEKGGSLFTAFPTKDELEKSDKLFTRVWDKVKNRCLMLGGTTYRVIERTGLTYQGQLSQILACLRPELSERDRRDWHQRILRMILGTRIDTPNYLTPPEDNSQSNGHS